MILDILRIEPSLKEVPCATSNRHCPHSRAHQRGEELLHEVKFDGWPVQLHKPPAH
jgi:hypothetical protein